MSMIQSTQEGFSVAFDKRRYEVRAIEKPSPSRLKATIKATSTSSGQATGENNGRFHIDTVDVYTSRSRRNFISEASQFFKDKPSTIEEDLQAIILKVESFVSGKEQKAQPELMSAKEELEGFTLGRSPNLIDLILKDITNLGIIGEITNKLVGYLTMTSRKMDDPLSLLILSGSGSGKSYLQDAILSLCPLEELIKVTSISSRALFYKGEHALAHKVFAIEEEAGAGNSHYAIRNLISSKKLVIETTSKNPFSGKLETQVNTVLGPTAVFQTTTQAESDAETRSRFIITSVDESPEQTKAIVEAQRNSHTLEGLLRRKRRQEIISRHHSFQRLLKPLKVVNPYEPLLTYGDDRLAFRRDHPKYLALILAVTFLHQMQRPIKKHPEVGEYIETTLEDIGIANTLAVDLFSHAIDELSTPSRRLLSLINTFVTSKATQLEVERCTIQFNRRELREAIGWSEYQLRIHISQLEELGYVVRTSGRQGKLCSYRLLEGESNIKGFRIKSVDEIRQEAKRKGLISS